jgi:nucleotide-binding universal stress UspA family protein
MIVFAGLAHRQRPHRRRQLRRALAGGRSHGDRDAPAVSPRNTETTPHRVVAVGDTTGRRGDADRLSSSLGASIAPVANDDADLLVIDSRATAPVGQTSLSSSAAHLIETARCPVLVVPRGVALPFGPAVAALA